MDCKIYLSRSLVLKNVRIYDYLYDSKKWATVALLPTHLSACLLSAISVPQALRSPVAEPVLPASRAAVGRGRGAGPEAPQEDRRDHHDVGERGRGAGRGGPREVEVPEAREPVREQQALRD